MTELRRWTCPVCDRLHPWEQERCGCGSGVRPGLYDQPEGGDTERGGLTREEWDRFKKRTDELTYGSDHEAPETHGRCGGRPGNSHNVASPTELESSYMRLCPGCPDCEERCGKCERVGDDRENCRENVCEGWKIDTPEEAGEGERCWERPQASVYGLVDDPEHPSYGASTYGGRFKSGPCETAREAALEAQLLATESALAVTRAQRDKFSRLLDTANARALRNEVDRANRSLAGFIAPIERLVVALRPYVGDVVEQVIPALDQARAAVDAQMLRDARSALSHPLPEHPDSDSADQESG